MSEISSLYTLAILGPASYSTAMAKEPQELKWLENLLPEGEYRRRSMFGGFSYTLSEKMVLATFESHGSRSYKGKKYEFELWNGCMFPVEKEFQDKALAKFPFLVNHPILPKWLYLPHDTEGFDELVSDVIAQVIRPTSYWGSIPKSKSKTTKSKRTKSDPIDLRMDTRRPRMFSDEPAQAVLTSAKKISDLKNLGPVMEGQLKKAGVKDAPAFIRMGWQKALVKLVTANPKNLHSIVAYTLIGALTNTEWNRIPADQKALAQEFVKTLRLKTKKK